MPIILPTFEVREKLTAEKLNSFRDAIEAKFSGGITPAEFTWPFVVQGNIDFAGLYGILNLKTFWNLINAAEYTSLQLACDAAASANGGTVIIPPDTEIETNGVNLNSSLVTIMGFGHSSVLKLSSGSSSGYFFRTATGGLTDLAIVNVAFDGQNTGTAQAGVIARRVTRFIMDRVYMKNFTGPFIQITHDGTPGNSSANVSLTNLVLTGGSSSSANHIRIEDCDGLILDNVVSDLCPTNAIFAEPTGAAGILRDFDINARVKTPTGVGITVLGASGTADAKWSNIALRGCLVRGNTGNAYELGGSAKMLMGVTVADCHGPSSGAIGLRIAAQRGLVSDNQLNAATTVGIDMQNSIDLVVVGNNCRDCTTYGINMANTTTCEVYGNNVQDCVTAAILATTSTTLRHGINFGSHSGVPGTVFSDGTSYSRTTTGDFSFTYTIVGGTAKAGDAITVKLYCSKAGAAAGANLNMKIGGTSIAGTGNFAAAAGTYIVTWTVLPVAVSADTDALVEVVGNLYSAGGHAETLAINWAVDNAITFSCTTSAAEAIGIQHITITINGAK